MEKTRMLLGVMVAVALVVAVATPAQATPTNLLINGDVETDGDDNGTPDGWTTVNTTTRLWATDESVSTSHSLKIVDDGNGVLYHKRWVGGIVAGTSYDFGGYFKTANNGASSAPRAQIQVLWYSATTSHTGTSSTSAGGVYDWKIVEKTAIAPANTTKGWFQFFTYHNKGVAWGDDFYLYVTPEPATMTLLLLGLPFALRRRRR